MSPPPASAIPTSTSPTGRWATAAGRSSSATRGRASSRPSARTSRASTSGDHVVFCFVPACGQCRACRAGRRTLCEVAGARSFAGTLLDGSSRLRAADGTVLQHGLGIACFAEYAVVPAGGAIKIPRRDPALAGGAAGLWRRDRLRRRQPRRRGADRRARVRDRLWRRRPAGDRRRAAGGRVADHRRRPRRREARARDPPRRHARGRRERRRRRRPDPRDQRRRRRLRVRGRRFGGDDPDRLGRAASRRHARSSSGSRRRGVEVSLPAIEFLSEKAIIGSYYGSADPAPTLPGLIELVRSGRLRARRRGLAPDRARRDRVGVRAPAPRRGRAVGRDPGHAGLPAPHGRSRRSAWNVAILDGLIGEGWSGVDPDGAHVNVVLARRGTATAPRSLTHVHLPRPRPRADPGRRRRGPRTTTSRCGRRRS